MRLIDADELKIDYGFTWDDITPTHDEMYALIDRQPTIEERKKGKWIHDGYNHPHGIDWMRCSECGRRDAYVPASMTNYCPNCGADMRGEEQEKK